MNDTLTYTRRDFSVKETGQEIRKALRAAFPGVKFSLRGSRGTGYGWFSLSWVDGPTTREADAVCNGFRSSYFDGMDDSTHTIPATMYALEDGTLYEPHWSCHGVNTQRDYSPEAEAWARSYVDAHGGPDLFSNDYGPDYGVATWRVLQGIDLVGVDWDEVATVTPGYSGRHVYDTYCVETGMAHWDGYEPSHRAEVAR
jgi:hypothetical protein